VAGDFCASVTVLNRQYGRCSPLYG
jgi:hypothetical protein